MLLILLSCPVYLGFLRFLLLLLLLLQLSLLG